LPSGARRKRRAAALTRRAAAAAGFRCGADVPARPAVHVVGRGVDARSPAALAASAAGVVQDRHAGAVHARVARGAVPAGGAAAPIIAADPVRAVRYARERRRGRRGGRSRSRRSGRRRRGGGCGGRRGWCARRPRAPRAVGVVDADVAMEEWHGGGAGVAWFRRQPRIPVPADHVRVVFGLDVNLTAHGEQRAEGAVRVGDGGIQLSDVALHMEAVGLGDQVAAGANAAGWRAGWHQARLLLGQVERPATGGW